MSSKDTSDGSTPRMNDSENFIAADSLRKYMAEARERQTSKLLTATSKADEARKELIRSLQQPVEVTPEKVAELKQRLHGVIRLAAENGQTEALVMRFPSALCRDSGRAINNSEAGWPETLTGRPRQAYEFWREHLQPLDYKLKAMIIEFPGGFPGDVAMFVSWS